MTDRTSELNFLLQSAPYDKPGATKVKGTDPRTQAFSASERSVENFRKSGKLRIVQGDVRDSVLLKQILDKSGTTTTDVTPAAAALSNSKLGRPKQKGHATTTTVIPPVTGVIHLAAYAPKSCRTNPGDCENVETKGMEALLQAFGKDGGVAVARPWLVVPRRADRWDEVRLPFFSFPVEAEPAPLAGFSRLERQLVSPLDRRSGRRYQGLHRIPPSSLPPPPAPLRLLHHRRSLLPSSRPHSSPRPVSTRQPPRQRLHLFHPNRALHRRRRRVSSDHPRRTDARPRFEQDVPPRSRFRR